MVMVLAATVKAPWCWCRSRPSFSHWVFDSLRPNDKVLPRSRLWRPRSTSRPAADGLRKQLNLCVSLAIASNGKTNRLLSSAAIAGVQVFQFFIRAAQFRGRCALVERRYRWRSGVSILYTGGSVSRPLLLGSSMGSRRRTLLELGKGGRCRMPHNHLKAPHTFACG